MFWRKKKPAPVPGSDAELVAEFRASFTSMQLFAYALRTRGISVRIDSGYDRGASSTTPEELRIGQIKRSSSEEF